MVGAGTLVGLATRVTDGGVVFNCQEFQAGKRQPVPAGPQGNPASQTYYPAAMPTGKESR